MEQKPLCPYFGRCGGCTGQHIPYELQVENKKRLIENLIKKSGISYCNGIKVFFDRPYHYRNRMDFVFSENKMGFRKKRKYKLIVDIDDCSISNSRLNILLKEVREWFSKNEIDAFNIKKCSGTLKYAVIRTPEKTEDSSISFVLNEDSMKSAQQIELIEEFAKNSSAKNIIIARVPKKTDMSISEDHYAVKGDTFISENILGKNLSYSTQGFFQNNSVMAEKMVGYCRNILEKYNTKKGFLLDLYGGVGTFGVCLADLFDKVLIVESFQGSIESAKQNILKNNIENTEAVCIDATSIKKLDLNMNKPLFVLTDPPRSGMHSKTIAHLLSLEPEVIVYVSCNPKQLSKELSFLKEKYDVNSAAVFDLFPQTLHTEAVVELIKKNN